MLTPNARELVVQVRLYGHVCTFFSKTVWANFDLKLLFILLGYSDFSSQFRIIFCDLLLCFTVRITVFTGFGQGEVWGKGIWFCWFGSGFVLSAMECIVTRSTLSELEAYALD